MVSPKTLEEAVARLAEGNARIIGGGTSIIAETMNPMQATSMKPPAFLVNLQFIEETKQLDAVSGWIGSRALMREMVQHPDCPALLREAIGLHRPVTQTRVIRNATLGGRLVADGGSSALATALMALGGEAEIINRQGRERRPLEAALGAPRRPAFDHTGIIVGVHYAPAPTAGPGRSGGAYRQQSDAQGQPASAAAVVLAVAGGQIIEAGVALSGVGRIAQRARLVEAALLGRKGSEELFTMAGQTARGEGEAPGANEEAREERRAQIDQVTREAVAAAFTVAFTVATG